MSPGEQLAIAIERLGAVQRQASWRGATPVGIGGLQARIIELLDTRAHGLTVSEAAAQLGVRIPTASTSVTALHRDGLLTKDDVAGSRAQLLTLTPAGRALAAQLRGAPSAVAAAADDLSAELLGTTLAGLSALVVALQRRGDIAPQRLCLGCAFFRPNADASGGPHRCALMDVALTGAELRLDCPDHQPASEHAVVENLAAVAI